MVQHLQVHRDITDRMPRIIESALWNAADKRHLATLESDADGTARTSRLALTSATAGFAVTAGFALPEALATMLRPGSGFKIM